MHCYAAFGGVDIDFTDAVWTSDEVVIDAYAVFGGVNVKVPDGVMWKPLSDLLFQNFREEVFRR